uniref:DNA 5'-3' helicase n=2 Tax=unclassified bacterial viruses TaxID=12333 RepID=A0AAU8KWA7_9VIRU
MSTKLFNLQFEQTVLCTLILNSNSFEIASGLLSERCFYADRHKYLFNAIKSLAEQGKPYTEGFIEEYLSADKETFKLMGGEEYLIDICRNAFSDTFNFEFYISELIKLADHRDVESIGKKIIEVANDTNQVDVFSSAESLLIKTDGSTSVNKTSFDAAESMDSLIKRMMEKSEQKYGGDDSYGVKFGIPSLDEKIGSIDAGHFCIIAGREGSGKSTLAQILSITSMLRYGKSCLFISAEMDKETLIARILSSYSQIPFKNIQRGIIYDGMFEQLTQAKSVIDKFKLIIEEKQMPTISEIRSYIRKAKRRYPDLGLVIVDYIGLIKDPSQKDRRLEMDSISRNLKAMGKEFNTPMVVLAQLNRENVKVNREPRSSDLKESGQLEADCDQIILVHPEVQNEEPTGTTKLIVSKNRHGEKGSVRVKNRLDICKFVDVAQD